MKSAGEKQPGPEALKYIPIALYQTSQLLYSFLCRLPPSLVILVYFLPPRIPGIRSLPPLRFVFLRLLFLLLLFSFALQGAF